MTKKLKRPLALLSSLAMMLTCLPGNMAQVLTTTASAADIVTFTVIAGDPDGFTNEGYDKLLDGATGTKWCCNFDSSASVVIKASLLATVTGYSIATGNDSASESGRNPVAWTLSGCNDYDEQSKSGGTWVVLDTITDGGLPAANETYTDFEIQDATGKYQYFKLNITQVKDGSLMQISELKLEYTTCDHQWELTGNVVAPTCEEDGCEIAKCAVCGEEKKTPNGVPATGHDWAEEKTVAPTCADDGYVVEKCSKCGAEKKTPNGESATGHDWVEERTVAPTCEDDGYVVEKCSKCGAEQQVFSSELAARHTWEKVETVPATCEKDGYDVEKCSVCDAERQVSNGEYATGHDWVENGTVPPTCYKDGYDVKKCSVCGAEEKIVNRLATGHEFDASSDEPDVCIHCGYSRITLSKPAQDAEGRYLIGTPGELYWFAGWVNDTLPDDAGDLDADAILTADITINRNLIESLGVDPETGAASNVDGLHAWVPIGYNSSHIYSGTFDGNNHTISGLYCDIDSEKNQLGTEYIGLFGRINGTVQNLNITDSYFNGKSEVGALCGQNDAYSTLSNCTVDAVVAANKAIEGENTNANVGGLSGYSESATVRNCSSAGAVYFGGSATYLHVGGLLGLMCVTSADHCYTTARVYSKSYNPLFGFEFDTKASNCYYLADSESTTDSSAKTAAQFASGEVAYLLAQSCTIGEGDDAVTYDGSIWGQEIGKDTLPVLNGMPVYRNEAYAGCVHKPGDPTYSYANTAAEPKYGDFGYENGFCKNCGGYEPAALNEDGVYEISNAGNLYWFAGLVNGTLEGVEQDTSAKAILTADITVNEDLLASLTFDTDNNVTNGDSFRTWTPIGGGAIDSTSSEEPQYICYDGEFDGQDHTISGLYLNDSDRQYAGLFGKTGEGATIINVKIADSYFKGNSGVGGVCGFNGGTIANCSNAGMISAPYYSGGVCGANTSKLINCYNTGTVAGDSCSGGVCGASQPIQVNGTKTNCIIANCYNTGEINGDFYVGGLCGLNSNGGVITNSYNTGTVRCTGSYFGGLCGGSSGVIANCYNTGSIFSSYSARHAVGGLCGIGSSNIVNCYYLDGCAKEGLTFDSTCGESKTIEQFNSGEVAYLLAQGCTIGEGDAAVTYDGSLWGQEIGKDDLPDLNGKTVYRNEVYAGCVHDLGDLTYVYANTAAEPKHGDFTFENGICQYCGGYEPATLNEDGVYEISNAGQLYWFAGLVNGTLNGVDQNTSAKAILTADITVNENLLASLTFDTDNNVTNGDSFRTWMPIGGGAIDSTSSEETQYICYDGEFDGQNHTISGLFYDTSRLYVGLFGRTGENAKISNVQIADSYFYAQRSVGSVCGYNGGTIANCSNAGTVSGQSLVGGICGYNERIVSDCSNAGMVFGGYGIGGVCGGNSQILTNCCNTGAVSGSTYVGGVCGIAQPQDEDGQQMDCTIRNCYNTGTVTGSSDSIGGICGVCNDCTITNCYNTGAIHGDIKVGGLCGYNDFSTITNSYNIGTVSGTDDVGGLFGRNSGSAVNCYYLDSCAAEGITFDSICGESKTIEQFNSGEVAYLLSQGCTIGEGDDAVTYSGSVWGQEIGKDDLPVLNGKTVYQNNRYEGCNNTTPVAEEFYSNTDQDIYGSHRGFEETGICSDCGLLEAAELNAEGVYEISNAGQLYWFAGLVNGTLEDVEQNTSANAILMADITINENLLASLTFDADKNVTNGNSFRSWTPIGNTINPYTGIFDGQEHKISGLYLNDKSLFSAGLFGYISNGTIASVGIVDSYIAGQYFVGGVCGVNNGGIIKHCYNAGAVNGSQYVGGLCGYSISDSIISASYNTGAVSGTGKVGCICGEIDRSVIVNCYNTGDVYGEAMVGGLCGQNQNGTIVNCYGTGRVHAPSDAESVGALCASNNGVIANCYYNNEMDNIVAASAGTGQLINVKAYTYTGFARGEVAYLLAQGCTVGEGSEAKFFDGSIWGLELGAEDAPLLNGKTVYRNEVYSSCSPEIGDPDYVYSNTKADPSFGDHEFSQGICTVCGKLENGRDAFLGASLTLTDGLILNYFLTLSEEALADPDACISFTSEQGLQKTILLSEGIATEDGMYKFSLKLRPDQMAEVITAKVVYSDGTPGSEVEGYSVREYAAGLVGEDTSEEEVALVIALLQYGGAAQLYTGSSTENLADDGLPAFDPNVTISDDYSISLSGAVDGIKIKGASLMADALTTIRVRCEVTKGSISDYTFTCDGVELTPVKSGKYHYVYIRSISPKDLSHMYSIVVTDKNGNTRTLNYGVLTYAKSIIEAEEGTYDSNLVNMMKALYYYSEAAKNY